MNRHEIRIGTLAGKGENTPEYICRILPHGFESFEINFWLTLGGVDVKKLALQCREVLAGSDAVISCLGIYGNPLQEDNEAEETRQGFMQLIDAAESFGCDLVCGFAGRLPDRPVCESMKRFKQVFEPIAKHAADKGIRIAFENCDMGGSWHKGDYNIAHNPTAWDMMFHELPMDNLGLEWEPCHQMVNLIDPIPQLRKWVKKIFHVHGKDATVCWDIIREYGIHGPRQFAFHRTPGFGDSNWTDVISILRQAGYKGAIDIEGWHDPVYKDDLEMTGQVHALHYLKECRGGDFIPNPAV